MRRRRVLGASARPTRERTGVPHIDPAAIWEPLGRLVNAFHECGEGGEWRKPAGHQASTVVRDAATGASIPVKIRVEPDPHAKGISHGQHELYIGRGGERKDVVVLKPNANFCMPEYDWKIHLRNILTHELTHVVDPGLPKSKGPSPRGDEGCKYLGNKHEVTAFLAQTRDELREFSKVQTIDKAHRKGFIKKPEDILLFAQNWAYLKRCLTPTQKKRFYRLAGMLWHEQGFSQPLGSIRWEKYAIPDEWKSVRGDVHVEVIQEAYDLGHGELKLHAKIGDSTVGELEAWAHPDGKHVQISSIAVGPRGRGVGTKLYEAAARWGCHVARRPLASDEKRSAAAEAFWRKQVRKKRARCEWRLTGEEARTAREDEKYAHPEHSIWARGGCVRYTLLRCPVKSLAGRRR